MNRRWTTTEPAGYLPAGLIVDVINSTGTTRPADGGQWIRVRYPNTILIGMYRDPAQLADELGIDLGSLEPSERNHQ